MTQAFPLQWPKGRARTTSRSDSRFSVKPAQAFDEMMKSLSRFGAAGIVVSTNIPLRQDGTPYRDGLDQVMTDPGVAVYFLRKKRQVCLPCDTYRRPWENIRALGMAVEAMLSMERHGAHQILDQAFEGFAALPPPGPSSASDKAWWVVLGCQPNATADQISAAYKAKAREAGGATGELNAAKDAGLAAIRP